VGFDQGAVIGDKRFNADYGYGNDIQLDANGYPVDSKGNEISTPQQARLFDEYANGAPRGLETKEEKLAMLAEGKGNWSLETLRKYMADNDITYTEAKDYAVAHGADPTAFGAGSSDKDSNIGPKTVGYFSRGYAPVEAPEVARMTTGELSGITPEGGSPVEDTGVTEVEEVIDPTSWFLLNLRIALYFSASRNLGALIS